MPSNLPNASANLLPPALLSLPGLDVARGLQLVSGQALVYLRLLRKFAVSHAHDMALLRECLAGSDAAGARRMAHTLKGSAGNMGASGVQQRALELDAAFKAGADAAEVERRVAALGIELGQLVATVMLALPETPTAAPLAVVDWPLAAQLLAQLEPLLTAGNMRANQLVETHSALLKAALGSLADPFIQQVAQFQHAEALQTLAQLQRQFNNGS